MDEEIQQKLRSLHRTVQNQLLYKLYVNVERFASKNGLISSSDQLCGDFDQLLQYVSDDCCNINSRAAKLLFNLVAVHAVSAEYLISLCVSQSALGRPVKSSVHLVLQLLQLQDAIKEHVSVDKHPLSRILTNQCKSSAVIFSTIQQFLMVCMENDVIRKSRSLQHAVESLKPFISFVVHDGVHMLCLLNELLDASSMLLPCYAKDVVDLVKFIVTSISEEKMVKKNGTSLLPVLQHLGVWYLEHYRYFTGLHLNWDLVSLLITVCWHAVDKDDSDRVYGALHLITKLIKVDIADESSLTKKECEKSSIKEELIFVCSMLLLKVDESLTSQLLQIIMLVLPKHVESMPIHQSHDLLSVLLLPVLQMLSGKKPTLDGGLVVDMAANLMRNIEAFLKVKRCNSDQVIKSNVIQPINVYSEILNVAHSSMYLLHELLRNTNGAIGWCRDVSKEYSGKPLLVVRENIVLQLSALLVCNYHESVFREALNAMVVMCKHDCNLVNVFLPLLLYFLRSKEHEHVKLDILYTFPKIATGKTVISSILKVILSLCECYMLLPVCTVLMTTLWMEQPRVYPYLLQLLNKPQGQKEVVSCEFSFELLLARVSSIVQVCKKMPTQHGEDMVVLISSIMEDIIKDSQKDQVFDKSASCLALLIEGLKALCISQVIDIKSIWKAVVAKVRLKNHRVILQSLCSLLSCFPALVGERRQGFLEEVIIYLWSLVQNEDPAVVSSAYKALSVFPAEMMKIKFLPEKVAIDVIKEMRALKEHKDDEEYDPTEEMCPGFGFMMLLHETKVEALEAFQLFLQAALQNEVSKLPRGIGSRSFVKPVASTYNQIPYLLQTQYESSNRPAVLPGIAAGILCCFEAKITGMDVENPSKSHLKLLMGRYKLLLDNLLQEVTIRQNDWHQAILAPRSWTHFMKKLYAAFIKGRLADLTLQREKGELDDDELYEEEMESAKFWARDEITNQLRKASKGTPKLQGNSICALVALVSAVMSYEEDDGGKGTVADQYIAMRTWLLKVTDTVMTVFDGNFKSKGKPFQWCQQVSSERSTASSNLSRCSAAIAISELVQPLLSVDTNRIIQMIHVLRKSSLGSANSGSVTQFHFYCFIGCGLLLSRLSQEQFSELAGNDGRNAMMTSLSTLEEIVFKEETNEQVGSVVAYGLVISSMFAHETQKDSKLHATLSYEKLLAKCKGFTAEETAMSNNQAFCFALASMSINAYVGGSISSDDVQSCAELIQEKVNKDTQSCDLYISLGVLCYALLISNSKQAHEFVGKIFDGWLDTLRNRDSSTLEKLGCAKGITAACGIDALIFKIRDTDKFVEIPQVKTAIKLLQKLVITSKENSLCYVIAQNLGKVHLISQVGNVGENVNIPQNLNYLKETAILRSIFNSLLSAATLGPYSDWSNTIVSSLITSLCNLTCTRLPPVNWTSVLNPVIRIGYDVYVKQQCIKFAIKFIKMSSSLTRSLSSWLQANVFLKMEDQLQQEFFASATSLLPSLSNSEQKGLLEILPLSFLANKACVECEDLKCVFTLWLSVLEMQCPIQSCSSYIMAGMWKLLVLMNGMSEYTVKYCLPEFIRCIYQLMRENWTAVFNELSSHAKLPLLLEIEMMKHIQNVQSDDILKVLLQGVQVEDVGVQNYLFEGLVELCRGNRVDLKTVKDVTQKLVTQDICKASPCASTIVQLFLMLSSPSPWIVIPSSNLSVESIACPVLNAAQSLLLFELPTWLSHDQIQKVQRLCSYGNIK